MRFPFGRGARQRELVGLRQRIAELQDEITKIQDSLETESPDIETTDAYRSVQLLRESMRREELVTLHEELGGLEARVEILTAKSRASSTAESATSADVLAEAAASVPGQHGLESTLIAESEPSIDENGAAGQPPEPEAAAPRFPVTGHGLPSERAIIEPTLPPRPAVPAAAAAGQAIEAEAQTEMPAEAADSEDAQPAAETLVTGEAPLEGEPVGLEPFVAEEHEAKELVAAEEQEAADLVVDEEQEAADLVAAEEHEAPELVATSAAVGSDVDAAEAVPVASAEAAERPAAERAGRSSSRWVLLLLAVAVIVITVVLALESGLVGSITGSAPAVAPTALSTRSAATVAPTGRPATVFPTLPPTAGPPTVPPLAAAPVEVFTIRGLTPADVDEITVERGTISAPPGFTGALLRDAPVLAARNLQFLPNGASVDILPGNATGSGFSWLRVRSTEGVVGWVISTVLGQ